MFIGYAKKIKEVTSDPIEDLDDDQLYYTHKYLKSVRGEKFDSITLDSRCEIFQSSVRFESLNLHHIARSFEGICK